MGKYDSLLREYQRNSTDDFVGAIDWKPLQQTKFTFEEEVDHYKADSYFTLAPSEFLVQEADGTPVSLGNWDSTTPYGIAGCNTGSMGSAYTNATTYTILSPAQIPAESRSSIRPATRSPSTCARSRRGCSIPPRPSASRAPASRTSR